MKALIFCKILFLPLVIFPQSGYFGKYNAINFNLNMVPTTRTITTVQSPDNNVQSKKLRLIYPNYQIGLVRQAYKRADIGLFYEFSKLKSVSNISYIEHEFSENTRILNDINFKKHQFGFHINFYRNKRIAPAGNYFGFSVNYGLSTLDENQFITHGLVGPVTDQSTFYNQTNTITSQFNNSIGHLNTKISYFLIRATVGKKFPINEHFTLTSSLSYPIISLYLKLPKNELNPIGLLAHMLGYQTVLLDDIIIEDNDITELMKYTNFYYNGIQLRFGLNYYF